MLSLSITTGYAIKALRCLESDTCQPRHITDVARCAGVPRPYLAKIIHSLSRHGLVSTRRGFRGGIVLARPAESISLLDIVFAVESREWMGDCLLAFADCSGPNDCPTLEFWSRIRKEIEQELARWTLSDLIRSRHQMGKGPPRCGSAPPQAETIPDDFAFSI